MTPGEPVGKQCIEAHVEAHVERLGVDGPLYTVPCPRGDELVQVQVYAHPSGHWHYVTYGFTSLFAGETPPSPEGRDGFGYELTYRVARESEAPPTTPIDLLRALARVLVEGRHLLAPGHTLPLAGPIAVGSMHSAFAVAEDPELRSLRTPLGAVQMLQLVGITAAEERACTAGSTQALLDQLRARDALLVTQHQRPALSDANARAGSQLEAQHVLALRWTKRRNGTWLVRIVPKRARETLLAVLLERLNTVGWYQLQDRERALRFERGAGPKHEERSDPPTLLARFAEAREIDPWGNLRRAQPGAPVRVLGCELDFFDDDPLMQKVYDAFADVAPALAEGDVGIVAVAGSIGRAVLVVVRSYNADMDAVTALVGVKGFAGREAKQRLGGELWVVEHRDAPLQFVAEALELASSAELTIDGSAVTVRDPALARAEGESRSDAALIAAARARVALVAKVLGREVKINGPWRVERR